jgi:hypothetical protein
MTPRPDLRALDDRVVPVAARTLRRVVDAVAAAGPRGLPPAVPALAGAALGVVALAIWLLATPAPGGPSAGLAPGTSGEPGDAAAVDPAGSAADAPLLAVVHLERHATPAEVPPLLAGTQVRRLYLHAAEAGPPAEVVVLPVQDAEPDALLPALCAATSERRARDARDLTTHLERLPATTAQEQQVLAELREQAARAAAEASAYAGPCATTFAAAVEAPEQALDQLAGRPGVRAVEPVPEGTSVDDVDVPPPAAGTGAP